MAYKAAVAFLALWYVTSIVIFGVSAYGEFETGDWWGVTANLFLVAASIFLIIDMVRKLRK